MDTILNFTNSLLNECRSFCKQLLDKNQDFIKLDFEKQSLITDFCVSILATFRLIQISNKMSSMDFFNE